MFFEFPRRIAVKCLGRKRPTPQNNSECDLLGLALDNAQALVADDKGLLAMDESNPTCNKRFAKLGIAQTVDARRDYRELIVTKKDRPQ
jgi:hypothetical protein